MLLAGEATETIASSTTGVAEDVVRIVEDCAGALSSALSPTEREKRRVKAKVKIDSIRHKESDGDGDPSFVTYGSYEAPSLHGEGEEPPAPAPETWRNLNFDQESLVDLVEAGIKEFWNLVEFAMADTQGVPSFAGELLGVLILCYVAVVWVVLSSSAPAPAAHHPSKEPAQEAEITHVVLPTSEDEISELSDPHDSNTLGNEVSPGTKGKQARASCCTWFIGLLLLPFRTLLMLMSMARRTICNKLTLLLVLHGGAWMYLCRASQLRSSAIQR